MDWVFSFIFFIIIPPLPISFLFYHFYPVNPLSAAAREWVKVKKYVKEYVSRIGRRGGKWRVKRKSADFKGLALVWLVFFISFFFLDERWWCQAALPYLPTSRRKECTFVLSVINLLSGFSDLAICRANCRQIYKP